MPWALIQWCWTWVVKGGSGSNSQVEHNHSENPGKAGFHIRPVNWRTSIITEFPFPALFIIWTQHILYIKAKSEWIGEKKQAKLHPPSSLSDSFWFKTSYTYSFRMPTETIPYPVLLLWECVLAHEQHLFVRHNDWLLQDNPDDTLM